jgi:hypothetical protein
MGDSFGTRGNDAVGSPGGPLQDLVGTSSALTFGSTIAPAGAVRLGILPRDTGAGVLHIVHGQRRPGNVGRTGLLLTGHYGLPPHIVGTGGTATVKEWW